MIWLESVFSFETKVGRGQGVLKLAHDDGNVWKAWTISTCLERLNSHELKFGTKANLYPEEGTSDETPAVEDPTVVIIGAG